MKSTMQIQLTPPVQLAIEFSRIINEWFTPEQLAEVNRLNATPEYANCCATHNFYDSNEAMAEAFNKVMGKECFLPCDVTEGQEAQNQAECDLMNEAWSIAKKAQFKLP